MTKSFEAGGVPRLVSRSRGAETFLGFGLILGILAIGTSSLVGQDTVPETPDVATLEKQIEEGFEAAIEMPDDEPMHVFQAWGTVFMSSVVLEQVRAIASGGSGASREDQEAAAERILARWESRRPDSAGPYLFRAFRLEDPTAKRDAILAVFRRFPDDALALWQATQELRQAGESRFATETAEAFVGRNPGRAIGYRVLLQCVRDNDTRTAEVLEAWAAAMPGEPGMVRQWLDSPVARQEPETTRRMLADFFRRSPSDGAALDLCREILRRDELGFASPAGACVARIAGDPDQPDFVVEQATTALAEAAASAGDWTAFVETLDSLDPTARHRALVAVAYRLEAPARCEEIVDLLSIAAERLGGEGEDGSRWSMTSAMRRCADHPAARALFLDLLRRAPAADVRNVVTGWAVKFRHGDLDHVWSGDLPPETAGILESRIEREADTEGAEDLYETLDIVYQIEDSEIEDREARRFELLERWSRLPDSRMDAERAVSLAWGLASRGRPDEAIVVLERQLERRFEVAVAEELGDLYVEVEGDERARAFADELAASEDPWERSAGHLFLAREALAREDLARAEEHYRRALDGERPSRETAIELLGLVGWQDPERARALAERICEETSLAERSARPEACAADLLTRAGREDAATAVLLSRSRDLPDDLEALEQLASAARTAGRAEIAESALRRILELDPRSESSWTALGNFLEKEDRADEVVELLERSREIFSPPPSYLARSAGRALTASGRPERAIDVLLEARGTLPDHSGGEWSRSWIDHELGEAYRALGETLPGPFEESRPPPARSFGHEPLELSETSPGELLRLAEALQTGSEGRYDPDTAATLYTRAAESGHPAATFRLAILRTLSPTRFEAGAEDPETLHRRSVGAVQELARGGDPFAAYLLGTAAMAGLGRPVDFGEAREWLELAAAEDLPWAWHNLAWMDETGKGRVEPDPRGAATSYRKAVEAGNQVSAVDLARLVLTEAESGLVCTEPLAALERSARAGNARAAAYLGKLLFYGRGECVTRAPDAAIPWLEAGVVTGQPGAEYDLGLALLMHGQSAQERSRGLRLLEEAPGPNPLALETLALLKAAGLRVRRDPAESSRAVAEAARYGSDGLPNLRREVWATPAIRDFFDEGIRSLEQLAAGGDAPAAAFLARVYQVDFVPDADPARAVELARQAAAAGEPGAMRVLMHAYSTGDGVEKSEAEARRWRRLGAEAGDSFCMMFLGHDLLEGDGVDRDLEAGLSWLRQAADAGNFWAVSDLARAYAEGNHGIEPDREQAIHWKRRLAALGDAGARGWLHYHGVR